MPFTGRDNTFICMECKKSFSNENSAIACEKSHYCDHDGDKYVWFLKESSELFKYCGDCQAHIVSFDLKSPRFKNEFLEKFKNISEDQGISNYGKGVHYTAMFNSVEEYNKMCDRKDELKRKISKVE